MKKILSMLFVASFASISGTALAAAEEVESGTPISVDDCELLRDRVTINLSSNVTMAYNCNVDGNVISVAACHSSGSQKPTDIACAITSGEGVTPVVWNGGAECDGTAGDTFPIEGRRVFMGSSTGGSVAAGDLNSTTCDMAALEALGSMAD